MNATIHNHLSQYWADLKNDFLPSVVVFLVALPLCMGIAIASGVPVAAGLITGIVGGIVVGMLAGAPLQVSGPAAGLTVIIYDNIQHYGLEALGLLVLMAGLFQVVAGVLRLGQWFRAVSPAVIRGMLAGIGVLIFASQFHVMVDDAPRSSGIANLIAIPEAIQKGLPLPEPSTAESRAQRTALLKQVSSLHGEQVSLGNMLKAVAPAPATDAAEDTTENVAAGVLSDKLSQYAATQEQIAEQLREAVKPVESGELSLPNQEAAQRAAERALAQTDAALAALRSGDIAKLQETQQAAGDGIQLLASQLKSHQWAAKIGMLTILTLVLWHNFKPKKLRAVPAPLVAVLVAVAFAAIGNLPVLAVEVPNDLTDAIQLPSLSLFNEYPPAELIMAALAMALIASAETLLCATAVDQMQNGQRTKYDRELWAQGIGNTICGMLGALPMTGVIVRSSANVQAGGKTRMSAIMHGVWLLLLVATMPFVLRTIPIAALAAILVYTGYRLVSIDKIKQLRQYGWGEVAIYFATLIGIVATDLLTGVLIGIGLSAAKLLYTFSHLETELHPVEGSKRVVLAIKGTATFLRLPMLATTLEEVPGDAELHVDFQHLDYIDHACLDLLMNWAEQHRATGGALVIDWDSLHAHFRGEQRVKKKEAAMAVA